MIVEARDTLDIVENDEVAGADATVLLWHPIMYEPSVVGNSALAPGWTRMLFGNRSYLLPLGMSRYPLLVKRPT